MWNKWNFWQQPVENPHFLHERPLNSENVILWYVIFEEDDGQDIVVTSQQCVKMIEIFLSNELQN